MEYINLKRALGGKDELNTHLVSLKTQYSNIKAKVSNLLFGGFGADLSFACALIYLFIFLFAVRCTPEKEKPDGFGYGSTEGKKKIINILVTVRCS